MNALDFNKIAEKADFKIKRKVAIKTKKRTQRFLKFIFRHIKLRAKKGYYFVHISKDVDYVDYAFIYNKLNELKFNINDDYSNFFSIRWMSNH